MLTSKLLLPVAWNLAFQLLGLVMTSSITEAHTTVLAVGDTWAPAPFLTIGTIFLDLVCTKKQAVISDSQELAFSFL